MPKFLVETSIGMTVVYSPVWIEAHDAASAKAGAEVMRAAGSLKEDNTAVESVSHEVLEEIVSDPPAPRPASREEALAAAVRALLGSAELNQDDLETETLQVIERAADVLAGEW